MKAQIPSERRRQIVRAGAVRSGTDGDVFDEQMTITHVFVEGKPVDLDVAVPPGNRRGAQ